MIGRSFIGTAYESPFEIDPQMGRPGQNNSYDFLCYLAKARGTDLTHLASMFKDDPVGMEKYQERVRGIAARLDEVLRRNGMIA